MKIMAWLNNGSRCINLITTGNGGIFNERNKAKIYLADRILDMIEKYGETGFGNKPENMDVVLY